MVEETVETAAKGESLDVPAPTVNLLEPVPNPNYRLLVAASTTQLMVWSGIEKLTMISGERTIGESSELLGSPGKGPLSRK